MATIRNGLKPFVLNLSDLSFLVRQVTFRPLFDSLGGPIINWNGVGSVTDDSGGQLLGMGGTVAGDAAALAAIATYGTSYASTTDLAGVRDVSGHNNNLLQIHALWGTVDQPFVRTVAASYTNYVDPLRRAIRMHTMVP